jgi:hypothetical protein
MMCHGALSFGGLLLTLLFRFCAFGFGGRGHSETDDESEYSDDEVQSLGVTDTEDAIL